MVGFGGSGFHCPVLLVVSSLWFPFLRVRILSTPMEVVLGLNLSLADTQVGAGENGTRLGVQGFLGLQGDNKCCFLEKLQLEVLEFRKQCGCSAHVWTRYSELE